MRTRVSRSFSFEAAHHLPRHPGKCRRLHGHHYRLAVTVEGPVGADGMVLDFEQIESVVEREIVQTWDHQCLNDFLDNPTAELVAARAWTVLEAAGLALVALQLWETPESMVELLA